MKNKTIIIILIVLLSIITILLTGGFIHVLNNYTNDKESIIKFRVKKSFIKEVALDKEYENIYDTIKVTSKSSDIEIKNSDSNNVRVLIYGKKEDNKIEEKEDILNIISNTKPCKAFCINIKITKIEIYIPKNYDKEIVIDNKFGDVKIEKFTKANIISKNDAGDIKIDSINNGTIDNKYGDITINEATTLQIMEDAGDIVLGKVNTLNANNKYGDIKIKEVKSSLNIKLDCGDIKIEKLNLDEDSTINNNAGDIKINDSNNINIIAKTNLGDTKINNNNNNSLIKLTINNNLGDIKINN